MSFRGLIAKVSFHSSSSISQTDQEPLCLQLL